MSKKIINITDITEFMYCPRKVYLKLVKGIRTPPNQRMIFGSLRHKVFDLFNKNERPLIESITEKKDRKEIGQMYMSMIYKIVKETSMLNSGLMRKFDIRETDLLASVKESLTPEISLRLESILRAMEKNFFANELWKNLEPKYLTEYKIVSEQLGLQGRVDRIKLAEFPLPVEIKTRDRVFESDKIQLAGYSLLLESEFNKEINSGIVELKGKTEKVELTPELKAKVLEIAEKIRVLTEENAQLPNNFEKCRNCELKENCN